MFVNGEDQMRSIVINVFILKKCTPATLDTLVSSGVSAPCTTYMTFSFWKVFFPISWVSCALVQISYENN